MRVPPLHRTLLTAALLLSLTGCKSDYDKAVEKAKADAVSTGQAQQVVSTDKSGNTTVTVVQPPATAGQAVAVQTVTQPSSAPMPASLPDYSNGARPAPGNTVTFAGPKGAVASVPPAAPGTVTGSTAMMSADSGAAMTGAPANEAPEPPPANFVPTNVTLPAGTGIAIRLNQTISVKHSQPGERFTGALAETISRDGKVVLPRGTRFNGVITEAKKRGHFKGRSFLGLRLTSMVFDGKTYPIETRGVTETKKGKGKRSTAFIGSGAGLGMLVGGVATGGVGLVVGGLAGGGLGTLLAGTTGNKDVTLPAESLVRFRLEDDLTVQPAQ